MKKSEMIWLYNTRISAVIAVIILHVAVNKVVLAQIGSEQWWFGNVYSSMVRWCVAVFVMISGALLLDPNKKENLRTFYKKRVSRIFLPLIFWSLFYLIWTALKTEIKGDSVTIYVLLEKILKGKPYFHVWFIFMLIPLYLFTPFFRKIVENSSRKELFILIIIGFIFSAINEINIEIFTGQSKLFINWFLSYIPFYFLGYYIRTDKSNYSFRNVLIIFILSWLATAFSCYFYACKSALKVGFYFYSFVSITVIPMSISLMYLFKLNNQFRLSKKLTKQISALTFGIYLIHPVFLDIFKFFGFLPEESCALISIPIYTLVIFILSILACWIISKIPYIKRII